MSGGATMKWRTAALAAGLTLAAAPAQAKFLDLYLGPKLGVSQGFGEGSVRGLAWGLELGAELLLFDAMVQYTQILGGKHDGATRTQFMLGLDMDVPIDGRDRAFLRVGGAAGFGLVTAGAPDFPIDDHQLSHKGLVLQGVAALEYHVTRFFVVGLEFGMDYHYFLSRQKIEDALRRPSASDPSMPPPMLGPEHWDHGFQFTGLLTARVHFEPVR